MLDETQLVVMKGVMTYLSAVKMAHARRMIAWIKDTHGMFAVYRRDDKGVGIFQAPGEPVSALSVLRNAYTATYRR